jgi:anti-sigma regulatory factor (Ser/Thr protein kinase)
VQAAALMGQVRAALRAYAHLDMPPAQVIASLDAVVSNIGDGSFVTCAYALFDPGDNTLTVCCAGHLPPVVYDGVDAAVTDVVAGPPLGLGPRAEVDEHVLTLQPGSVVAMCTDGLVESREQEAETGLACLAELLAETGDASLEDIADAMISALLDGSTADDTALLLVRPRVSIGDTVRWMPLERTPEVVADMRRHLHRVAAYKKLTQDFVDGIAVVASELVTNAIRHGRGDPSLRLRLTPSRAVVEVEDGSGHLPQRRFADQDDEGGRGLELVSWLSARWGWRPTAHGKVVWAELVAPEG